MTTLENARLYALDRWFRGTDVQVIENHSKAVRLGLTDQTDLRRMRQHGFRDETSSLFRDLNSNHSRRDELAVVVDAVDEYSRVLLFANDFCAPVVQLHKKGIQVRVPIVSLADARAVPQAVAQGSPSAQSVQVRSTNAPRRPPWRLRPAHRRSRWVRP